MLDPLDNPKIAAAIKIRAGRSGPDDPILFQFTVSQLTSSSATPRAATSRGVRVFGRSTLARAFSRPPSTAGVDSRQATCRQRDVLAN